MPDLYRQRSLEATRLNTQTLRETKRRIAKLYEKAAEDIARSTASAGSKLTQTWASAYIKELRSRVTELWRDVGELTQSGMQTAATRTVGVQISALNEAATIAGLDLRNRFAATFAHTPDEAVAAIFQGGLYSGDKAMLSKRIWKHAALQSGQLEAVIAEGIAKQQSPMQLAKALEAFINPDAAKEDDWSAVYETPFPIKVDFNAKRLAVTAINQSAWSGMMMAARENPYADCVHWELSAIHGIYDICDLHADHDEGLGRGNYALDNVPLPHPFCNCIWYADTAKSLDDIARELYRWEQGESNPKLDEAFSRTQSLAGAWDSKFRFDTTTMPGASEPEPEVLKAVKEAYDIIAKDFPILNNSLDTIYFGMEDGIASARTDGRAIIMDGNVFRTLASATKTLTDAVRLGHTIGTTNPMFIFAHEVGHTLLSQLAQARIGTSSILYGGLPYQMFKAEKVKIATELFVHSVFTTETVTEIYQRISDEMGGRALDNYEEMIAQAVAMKYYGIGDHPISDSFVAYLKAEFDRRR